MLLGGILVKDYYLDLVDGIANLGDPSKESTESDIEGFEQDLQSLLQVHFTVMKISSKHDEGLYFSVSHLKHIL